MDLNYYFIKFDKNFGKGDVISNEPNYGAHYAVTKVVDGLHRLEPLNVSEGGKMEDFISGNLFVKVSHILLDDNEGFEFSNIPIKGQKSEARVI